MERGAKHGPDQGQRPFATLPGDPGSRGRRGFTALCPDLPGCIATGETPEEALATADEARRLRIRAAYEAGEPIPLPATERAYSGRLLVRMPRSLHRRLAEEAEREGVGLNQYVVALLQERSSLPRIERLLR